MPGVFGTTQTARTGINPALLQRNIQTARAPVGPPVRRRTPMGGPAPGGALGQLAARIAMMQGRR